MKTITLAALGSLLCLSPVAAQTPRAGAGLLRANVRAEPSRPNYWLSRDLTRLYTRVSTIKLH